MKRKKLYLVSRDRCDYDEYDSAVICAYTSEEALLNEMQKWEKVEYIGIADDSIALGCVLGSFNAG